MPAAVTVPDEAVRAGARALWDAWGAGAVFLLAENAEVIARGVLEAAAPLLRPGLLTIDGAAAALQVSPRTVRRAIDTGGLRAHQVGEKRAWRIDPDDLAAWLEGRANTARPVATPAGQSIDRGPGGGRQRRRAAPGVLHVPPGMGRKA